MATFREATAAPAIDAILHRRRDARHPRLVFALHRRRFNLLICHVVMAARPSIPFVGVQRRRRLALSPRLRAARFLAPNRLIFRGQRIVLSRGRPGGLRTRRTAAPAVAIGRLGKSAYDMAREQKGAGDGWVRR